MQKITVAVIGGSGFLGQHIVRELQQRQLQQERKEDPSLEEDATATEKTEVEDENGGQLRGSSVRQSWSEEDTAHVKSLLGKALDRDEADTIRIQDIRVLDIKPFNPDVDIAESPPVEFRQCDIRLKDQLSRELEGVGAVIHCAAILPSVVKPSKLENENLYLETNLEGTKNIVWACHQADVRALIYTSTVFVVLSGAKVVHHSETLTPVAADNELLLASYGKCRRGTEDVITSAHQTTTKGGEKLRTIVLRLGPLFGEGDSRLIPAFIKMAKNSGGKLAALGTPFAYHQLTYAGNAAVAHVCALIHLIKNSTHPLRDCGGMPVFISDDSPPGLTHHVLSPFLSDLGLSTTPPTDFYFRILVNTFVLTLWTSFWRMAGRPCDWQESVPNLLLQKLAASTAVMNRTRAELGLKYGPKYSWEYSRLASVAYYKKFVVS